IGKNSLLKNNYPFIESEKLPIYEDDPQVKDKILCKIDIDILNKIARDQDTPVMK
ncbi:4551_t:CDS:2, partial [Racocetra fulgida]